MYEVSHTPSIIKFQPIDLSGDTKQTAKVLNTSAPLLLSFSPVSELLYELLHCKHTEMLYELFSSVPANWLQERSISSHKQLGAARELEKSPGSSEEPQEERRRARKNPQA